jgi:hypothetical protein
MSFLDDLAKDIERRRERHLLRAIRPTEWVRGPQIGWNGRALINLCHNDYLGLSREPKVIEAACAAAREWGAGSGASRLITGSPRIVAQLEEELAAFKRADAALAFPDRLPGQSRRAGNITKARRCHMARSSGAFVPGRWSAACPARAFAYSRTTT